MRFTTKPLLSENRQKYAYARHPVHRTGNVPNLTNKIIQISGVFYTTTEVKLR